MSALAALYPSSSSGSGITLSPLSTPAPVAAPAEPLQAAQAPAATLASTEARSSASGPPGQPQGHGDVDAEGEIAAMIDAAMLEHGAEPAAEAEPDAVTPPLDMTVDERPDYWKDARINEIPAQSATDYAAVTKLPHGIEPDEEFASAMRAAAKAGVGITSMAGFFRAFVETARSPIRTSPEAAAAALQAEFGDKMDAKLASAKAFIGELERTWPTVRAWLATSGLGNDPAFIKQIAARAERRGL